MMGPLRSLGRAALFPGDPTRLPERVSVSGRPDALRVAYETADGVRLAGMWMPPPPVADAPVVLFFHGNAESASLYTFLLSLLAPRGFGLLLAEYRGYGGCPGRPTEAGLYADGEGAVAFLGREGVASDRVVFLARSLGTGVSVDLATRHPVRGMVLQAPYTSIPDTARHHFSILPRRWVDRIAIDRFDSLGKAALVRCPTVIVHGKNDPVVPFRLGERLAAAIPGAELVALPGLMHNDVFSRALDRVLAAVDRVAR